MEAGRFHTKVRIPELLQLTVASLQRHRPGHMSANVQVNRLQDSDIRKATERDIPPKMKNAETTPPLTCQYDVIQSA